MEAMASLNVSVVSQALSADIRQAIASAAQLGFAGVQCDAFSPSFRLVDLSITGQREFQRLLANQSQRLVGLRMELGPQGLMSGADIDHLLDQVDQAMHITRSLAAELLCIDLGRLPAAVESVPKPQKYISPVEAGLILIPQPVVVEEPPPAESPKSDPAAAQFDAALSELGSRADRYSTTVAFRSDLASLASLEQALQRVRCPWFAIDLDPVSILQEGRPIDEIFSRLGPWIRHIRCRDGIKGSGNRTQTAPLGRGDTDWNQLLHALDEMDYRGWLTVDPVGLPSSEAAAIAALQFLRRLSVG
jgi:sugar phosphate isomerase/epimerase